MMKLKKNQLKNKQLESTRADLSKLQPVLRDWDNFMESEPKQIMKLNSQSLQC
jgi:hypothetical protein